ncbi:MAG: flagellar motor switch protein FliG, partial [Alphaproteobacteria bacterium]|nr:flagellar motor switch protein FliG [Alphaproteobacteria bacterium]
MHAIDDLRALTGPQKAAVLVLSLSEDQASKIFGLMDDDEIKEISQAMASLGTISSDTAEHLYSEFFDQVASSGSLLGTFEGTERLLLKTLGKERVDMIMEEIRGPAGRTMWDKLGNVNEEILAAYLKNEYPQTVAVVMTKIRPDHAARVLTCLPEEFALEVIGRMLRMEAVQRDVLDSVERTLRTEFMSNLARTNRRDAHELIADIFNNLDRQAETRFMTALEDRNRDSAERIKALMFTFEDLGKLPPEGVQTLLRQIEKDKLGLALVVADDDLALRGQFLGGHDHRHLGGVDVLQAHRPHVLHILAQDLPGAFGHVLEKQFLDGVVGALQGEAELVLLDLA